jgi:hypothetical protein
VLRYWWVAAKLGLNLLLIGLVLVALAPEVDQAGRQGRQFLAGEPASLAVGDLIFPPIVSPTALSWRWCSPSSSRGGASASARLR